MEGISLKLFLLCPVRRPHASLISLLAPDIYAGFHTGFFLGRERLCVGKLISCAHRPQPPWGIWGHASPEKF